MKQTVKLTPADMEYLKLLAAEYPDGKAAYTEIINLQAILNLPKGTEHFMSDLHGEDEAFRHIMNNCSGVIREKVDILFGKTFSERERADLCTLIYYPKEKIKRIHRAGRDSVLWYRITLNQLIELAKFLSSKYSRSKVRKAMPKEYRYILDEMLHAQQDEDNNQQAYHAKIVDSIFDTDSMQDFVVALSNLIKRLAVDHLHIVGDIYDHGPHADRIMDMLMKYRSLDIEWGNHDIVWMGAAAGSEACIAAVLHINIAEGNYEVVENGYGINLRPLSAFAEKTYTQAEGVAPLCKALAVLRFKLEGQLIRRHPEYEMDGRLLLDKIDTKQGTLTLEGKTYSLNTKDFPTLDAADPYALTEEEAAVMAQLREAFRHSERLNYHVKFLYTHGSMYRCCNENLMFHGCIPLCADGTLDSVPCDGEELKGMAYLDYADQLARSAYEEHDKQSLDGMWYLWTGSRSPLCGRAVSTFEQTYFADSSEVPAEKQNPYYACCDQEEVCRMLLGEFGLDPLHGHIINGHTPVRPGHKEKPVRCGGRLIVIDGGLSTRHASSSGIAGYTLIFNSHCMKLKAHRPFSSVEKVLDENSDIQSETSIIETEEKRIMVSNTDDGRVIARKIERLQQLLNAYRTGALKEKNAR